jgi:hypothetical protein
VRQAAFYQLTRREDRLLAIGAKDAFHFNGKSWSKLM